MRVSWAWPVLLAAAALLPGCADLSWPALPNPFAAEAEAPGARALRFALGGRGETTHALLVQEQGRRRMWRAMDGSLVLATDGPRVVATAGPDTILLATRIDPPDPLSDPFALERAEAVARRVVDLSGADRDPRSMRFGLVVECRLAAGTDPGDPALMLVEERCRGPRPIGEFTNRFWLRPEREEPVARSEQWIGPGLPLLRIATPPHGRRRAPRERRGSLEVSAAPGEAGAPHAAEDEEQP
jgi:hypothetical protein